MVNSKKVIKKKRERDPANGSENPNVMEDDKDESLKLIVLESKKMKMKKRKEEAEKQKRRQDAEELKRQKLKEEADLPSFMKGYKRIAVPVGPNHQVTIVETTYLGTQVWPPEEHKHVEVKESDPEQKPVEVKEKDEDDDPEHKHVEVKERDEDDDPEQKPVEVKERDESSEDEEKGCGCLDPETIQCYKKHMNERNGRLEIELGREVYREWQLDLIGENFENTWNADDSNQFFQIAENFPPSSPEPFWDILSQRFPEKKRDELVRFYYDVYLLKKMVRRTRDAEVGSQVLSDDGEVDITKNKYRRFVGRVTQKQMINAAKKKSKRETK